MRRRHLLQGLLALTLEHRLASLNAARAEGNKPLAPGLRKLSGTVLINGKPAWEGMAIRPGDVVSTGPNSEAIYVIDQDAYLQRDQSTVTIVGDSVRAGLRILSGKLLSVFAKGARRIETATATIGIRGTGCYIESAADRVYFCLCYGTAEVSPNGDPQRVETITTRHHDHPVYIGRDGRQMMVAAGVINHSDAELVLLESLVGRTPPFQGKDWKY